MTADQINGIAEKVRAALIDSAHKISEIAETLEDIEDGNFTADEFGKGLAESALYEEFWKVRKIVEEWQTIK